jgi:hypothetical protein
MTHEGFEEQLARLRALSAQVRDWQRPRWRDVGDAIRLGTVRPDWWHEETDAVQVTPEDQEESP